ncbi:hypothetical protein FRC12_022547 [Ceratobasidium sp. 428]|nr:hypothetical protein FRC12_022547 [Ceratobasidium sp. 428]
MDAAQRLRRRMAALDALESVSADSQLDRDREHDPSAPLPSVSSSIRNIDQHMARIRMLGRGVDWEDGRDDPNGERITGDNGTLSTPASRSRYWNALSNVATENLLALAAEMLALLTRIQSSTAERTNRAPLHPPGLASPTPQPVSTTTKSSPIDPLPSPLGTMLLPTPKQRFKAAFHSS